MYRLGGNLLGRGGDPLKAEGPGIDERPLMEGQISTDEVEYWMELEALLARFHQDLARVEATLTAIGEEEVAEYLVRAQLNVGAACCAVAVKVGSVPASVIHRT